MALFSRRPALQVQVDPHLADDLPLIDAAHDGDAASLGARLAELRAQGRWHHRHQLVTRAARADRGTGWIETWARDSPGDVDALVTRAVAEVRTARASEDPARRLAEASLVLDAARDRAPGDPTVWTAVLDQAHGLGQDAERVRALVLAGEAACPTGFAWRAAGVELLSGRWHGSTNESWDFAVTSAEVDPRSRLVLLPAYAALSALRREADDIAEEMLAEALPPALEYVAASDDDVDHVEAANGLAARLVAASRRREAPLVLDLVGERVDALVWGTVVGGDPVESFLRARRAMPSR